MARRWEYLVTRFGRRGTDLWWDSSEHGRVNIDGGGVTAMAEMLNVLGQDGWELVHCDDSPARVIVDAGSESVHAWGDMIFKRPA